MQDRTSIHDTAQPPANLASLRKKEFFMELGLVRKIDIDREMQAAYLDYAMSVIVSRALPDAREGHLEGLSNLRDEADRQEA